MKKRNEYARRYVNGYQSNNAQRNDTLGNIKGCLENVWFTEENLWAGVKKI